MSVTEPAQYSDPGDIEQILQYKNIAVVGISPDPFRPSHQVASYMQRHGYRIVPVNPYCEIVLNEKVYRKLENIPFSVDVVNIFRRFDVVGDVVDQAIRKGAKAVWLQEGVVDYDAANRARRAGLLVVMDRCILKEHAYRAEQRHVVNN